MGEISAFHSTHVGSFVSNDHLCRCSFNLALHKQRTTICPKAIMLRTLSPTPKILFIIIFSFRIWNFRSFFRFSESTKEISQHGLLPEWDQIATIALGQALHLAITRLEHFPILPRLRIPMAMPCSRDKDAMSNGDAGDSDPKNPFENRERFGHLRGCFNDLLCNFLLPN